MMNVSVSKREVSIMREPHKIRLMSIGKCPKCGQAHNRVGMRQSKTPTLFFGTCPVNKTNIWIVETLRG